MGTLRPLWLPSPFPAALTSDLAFLMVKGMTRSKGLRLLIQPIDPHQRPFLQGLRAGAQKAW